MRPFAYSKNFSPSAFSYLLYRVIITTHAYKPRARKHINKHFMAARNLLVYLFCAAAAAAMPRALKISLCVWMCFFCVILLHAGILNLRIRCSAAHLRINDEKKTENIFLLRTQMILVPTSTRRNYVLCAYAARSSFFVGFFNFFQCNKNFWFSLIYTKS